MKPHQAPLLRRQYLISEEQVAKIEKIAAAGGMSAAETVRMAIDAFDPESESSDMGMDELMGLVHGRLQEAIESTRQATKLVSETADKL